MYIINPNGAAITKNIADRIYIWNVNPDYDPFFKP